MTGQAGRIKRIETSLTPSQAVMLWMEEAHRHGSIRAYATWLVDQPDAVFPLFWLCDRVEPPVRQAMKGQSRDAVEWAIYEALREAAFLFHLHQQANLRILQDWRALHLNLALLLVERRLLLADHRLGNAALKDRRARWRGVLTAALVELYALTGAMERLGARYFRGHPVLFEDAAQGLAWCLATAETLVEQHNDAIEFAAHPEHPTGVTKRQLIELAAVREATAGSANRLAAELVALARAETFALLGEHHAIADVLRPSVAHRAASADSAAAEA
ncbi:MAG: hypothetical protein FJ029_09165 [Actinobacteria bacterium]|nr:hypothetical protein [Actinomycetota bacterium]